MRMSPVSLSCLALALTITACAPSESAGTGAVQGSSQGSSGTDSLTLRYFGAAGWEISAGSEESADRVVVLVDPYLTRANYSGGPSEDPSDTRPIYTWADTLFSDTDVIDAQIERAD